MTTHPQALVEAVARAACVAKNDNVVGRHPGYWQQLSEDGRERWRKVALAALDAANVAGLVEEAFRAGFWAGDTAANSAVSEPWDDVERALARFKQAAKPKHSPLPVTQPDQGGAAVVQAVVKEYSHLRNIPPPIATNILTKQSVKDALARHRRQSALAYLQREGQACDLVEENARLREALEYARETIHIQVVKQFLDAKALERIDAALGAGK